VHEWAAEIAVGETLARRLIAAQFPELELRSLRLLGQGWDMTVWLVDERWVFRFPRREAVIRGLANEVEYLPQLAPLVPLAIPHPTHLGHASSEYPWPFSGSPVLAGRELGQATLDDDQRAALARPLGTFLRTLHGLEFDAELPLDPVGRADMTRRAPATRARLRELDELRLWKAPPEADAVIDAVGALDPPQPTALVHGDLHLRHLLVDDACRPAAVIDWIDLSFNSPGVDLVLYWSSLPAHARDAFAQAYGSIPAAELLRGRLLALFLCATVAVYAHHEGMPTLQREALAGLDRTLDPS